MSKLFKAALIIGLFLLAPVFIQTGLCQPPPPTGPPCWPPPCVPIDGGISFLIVAGVAYGGRQAYKAMKK